jgi:hypothetical protein
MNKRIRTVGDVRDERALADAIAMNAERAAQIKYLRDCRNHAIVNGWVDMAARYSARISRIEEGRP